jgi:competence protein ComEC
MERYPALKLFLFFMLGILAASAFSIPFVFSAILLGLSFLLTFWKRGAGIKISYLSCLLALILSGYISYQARHLSFSSELEHKTDQSMIMRIVSEPRRTEGGWRFLARATAVLSDSIWRPADFKAMAYAASDAGSSPSYGDILMVSGLWRQAAERRNPGGFDYRQYLEHQEVSGILNIKSFRLISHTSGNIVMSGIVIPLRQWVRGALTRYLEGDQASLMAGLLLGERYNLSFKVREAFSNTGTAHVLAVSGLHAALMAFIIFLMLRMFQFPKKAASLGTILGLLLYTLLAGASPSIVRSSIMVGAVMLGGLFERKGSGLNMLGLAGLLILAFWPDAVFDVGFQLSFSATAGILIMTRPLEKHLFKITGSNNIRRWLLTPLAVSLAAQVFTAPFMAWHFHRIPMISLAANLIVVPLTSLILALGLSLVLFNVIGTWATWPVAASAYLGIKSLLGAVDLFDRLRFGTIIWPSLNLVQLLLYGGLLTLPFIWKRGGKHRLALITAIMASASIIVWQQALAMSPSLRISFLDVGQGDCALVEMPNGKKYLIDAGLYTPNRDSGRDIILPVLRAKGITKLDAVLISHSDADHCGGLSYLVERMQIDRLIISDHPSDQKLFNQALAMARTRGIPVVNIAGYDTLCGVWPVRGFLYSREDSISNGNESSLVLCLQYGTDRFLFPGDMGPELGEILHKKGLFSNCRVVKVPHHGARPNNQIFFVDRLRPELAVISVGENNRFGHPSQEALDNYANCGSKILRTDLCGAVMVESDGEKVKYTSMIK